MAVRITTKLDIFFSCKTSRIGHSINFEYVLIYLTPSHLSSSLVPDESQLQAIHNHSAISLLLTRGVLMGGHTEKLILG